MSERFWVIDGRSYSADEALVLLLEMGLISIASFANYAGRASFDEEAYIVNPEGQRIEILKT